MLRCGDFVLHVNNGDFLAEAIRALPSRLNGHASVAIPHLAEASALVLDAYSAAMPDTDTRSQERAASASSCH